MLLNYISVCFVFFINFTICILTDSNGLTTTGEEYCQFENFSPKCSVGHVVIVTKALFGRMRVGRCITEKEIKSFVTLIRDQKYLGCYIDALDLISDLCSLNSECAIKVSDIRLTSLEPCSPGLNLHIEVEYNCIPVYKVEDVSCQLSVYQEPKYLLYEVLQNSQCGTMHNPWIFEVAKGQKLRVKLVSVGTKTDESFCENPRITFQDGSSGINSSFCKNEWSDNLNQQVSLPTYKSTSNVVKMYVLGADPYKKKFALKLEGEGCLDIIPPEDTWLKRTNDDIVVGCYSSKQIWYLRCENGQWTGVLGNCSSSARLAIERDTEDTSITKKMLMSKNQQVLAIVSIFGMGIVICSAIVCAGAVCARRYKFSKKINCQGFVENVNISDDAAFNHHTYTSNYESNKYKYNNGRDDSTQNGSSEKDQTYFVLEEEMK